MWLRSEETAAQVLVPGQALIAACVVSHVCLAVRGCRLELPIVWGELRVALKRHTNECLLRGCTNDVFHGTGNTASTTPTLHETRTEADKADSMPC